MLDQTIPPLEVARIWATRGFPAFPIAVRPHGSALKKRPLTDHGHNDATLSDAVLTAMFANRRPNHDEAMGVGINPGPAGYVVLDPDRKGGVDGVALADSLGLPACYTVDTPSGGEHRYFDHPGGTIGNTSPWKGKGIDVRADAGWVVAAGVSTPWGSWTARRPWDRALVATLPAHVVAALCGPSFPPEGNTAVTWSPWMERWVGKTLKGAATDVRKAKPGKRNDVLSQHAGYSARKLAGSGAPEFMWDRWSEAFTVVGLSIGLEADELRRTLKTARAYGFRKPHPIGSRDRMETRVPCKAWLFGWMVERGGLPIQRSEALAVGKTAGYSERAVRYAAASLGMVVTHAEVFPKVSLWSLPETTALPNPALVGNVCTDLAEQDVGVGMVPNPALVGNVCSEGDGPDSLVGNLCKNHRYIGTAGPVVPVVSVVTGEIAHQRTALPFTQGKTPWCADCGVAIMSGRVRCPSCIASMTWVGSTRNYGPAS